MPRLPLGLADVAGSSMLPTLRPGDVVVVRWGARVRPGDVVVLRRPDRPDLLVVKRVVWREPDGWEVRGDNPAASDDSRAFGLVPDAAVVGRVLVRRSLRWRVPRGQPTARRRAR